MTGTQNNGCKSEGKKRKCVTFQGESHGVSLCVVLPLAVEVAVIRVHRVIRVVIRGV